LVSVLVIGILATVLIIRYQGVQEKAYQRAMESDLANFALAAELHGADNAGYPSSDPLLVNGFSFTPGVGYAAYVGGASSWTLIVEHAKSRVRCSRRGGVAVSQPATYCTEGDDGENLVLNGDGAHLSNENFPGWEFVNEEAPEGLGFFRRKVAWATIFEPSQSLLPVDPTKAYEISAYFRTVEPSNHIHYLGFSSYDADRQWIQPHNIIRVADTRLAQSLGPGDTIVHLQSSSGWYNETSPGLDHVRSLAIWGYRNASGHRYPDYTYTRHSELILWENGAIDQANHTIRLNKP
jgi:type II secretory pathway pseudopilin PulG